MNRGRQLLAAALAALWALSAASGFASCGSFAANDDGRGASGMPAPTHACCQRPAQDHERDTGVAVITADQSDSNPCSCVAHAPSQTQATLPTVQRPSSDDVSPCTEVLPSARLDSPLSDAGLARDPPQIRSSLLLKAATGLRSPPAA